MGDAGEDTTNHQQKLSAHAYFWGDRDLRALYELQM